MFFLTVPHFLARRAYNAFGAFGGLQAIRNECFAERRKLRLHIGKEPVRTSRN